MTNTSNLIIAQGTLRSQKFFVHDISHTGFRDQIGKDMDDEFIRCPVDAFIKAYLPFAPNNADMDYFMKKLPTSMPEDSGTSGTGLNTRNETMPKASILVGEEPNLLFRRYLDKDITRASYSSEIVAYGHWSDIAAEISKIPYPENRRTRNRFTYVNMPHRQIESNIPGSDNKIDAAVVAPCDESRKVRTHDIAVVIEHKLEVQRKRDNALQAVSANVQIMNDDARRMFTFGITAESNEMTLWYHSRSHSAASERFRFTQDPRTFIRVLIAFLFATDDELGYDPMVALENDGQYTFKVPDPNHQDQFYRFRTIETLSFYRSNNITGRMARVYKASRINGTGEAFGESVVLKDVWLDESSQTEREIQNAIFSDIEKFWTKDDAPAKLKRFKDTHDQIVRDGSYKHYFLEIVQDHQGRTTHPLAEGGKHEKGIVAHPDLTSRNNKTGTKTTVSFPNSNAAVDTHPIASALPKTPEIPRTYAKKRQYRVVFKEVCKTVGRLETLGQVVNVLFQTLIPLQLLFCAGWVHRDISSGNILAYKKDWNSDGRWAVKLSDLEYARKFPLPEDAERASDPKTGTPYFMPIEVMMQKYIYSALYEQWLPKTQAPQDQLTTDPTNAPSAAQRVIADINALRAVSATATDSNAAQSKRQNVTYNFQHDLESIWWILLWTICVRLDPAQSTKSLLTFGSKIFVNTIRPNEERVRCFENVDFRTDLASMAPESIIFVVSSICVLRDDLHKDYTVRGRNGAYSDVGSYAEIHSGFYGVFEQLDGLVAQTCSSLALYASGVGVTSAQSAVSAAKKPERKRARYNEDYDTPRTVEDEGRTRSKRPKTQA